MRTDPISLKSTKNVMLEKPTVSGLGQSRSTRVAPQSLATPLSNLERAAHGRKRLTPTPLASNAVRNVAAKMRASTTVSAGKKQVTLATTPPAQVLPSFLPSQHTAAADNRRPLMQLIRWSSLRKLEIRLKSRSLKRRQRAGRLTRPNPKQKKSTRLSLQLNRCPAT